MSPPQEPELSVLVISYNTRDLTLACLEALQRTTDDLAIEIIVFDNASTDGSARALSERYSDAAEVVLIASDENLGFARANNLSARRARGCHLLLLNPDTLVRPGAVGAALAFAREHPEAGVVGGRTFFPDGSLNPASCWGRPTVWSLFCHALGLTVLFRGNRLLDPESLGSWQRDSVRRVDIVSGCFLLIERTLWRSLEGFDEDFFMYGEDADLSLRATAAGRPCMITPAAELVHYGGASESVRSDKMVRLFRAKAQLFAKHWSPGTARFGTRMLGLWAFTRMLAFRALGILRSDARASASAWLSIWRRRDEWRVRTDGSGTPP